MFCANNTAFPLQCTELLAHMALYKVSLYSAIFAFSSLQWSQLIHVNLSNPHIALMHTKFQLCSSSVARGILNWLKYGWPCLNTKNPNGANYVNSMASPQTYKPGYTNTNKLFLFINILYCYHFSCLAPSGTICQELTMRDSFWQILPIMVKTKQYYSM